MNVKDSLQLMCRKSIIFGNHEEAEQCLFEILDLTVKYNRLQVMTNEEPEYPSPLWYQS